jgi:hypothetical protein
MEAASDLGPVECLLLVLAWSAMWMWRSVKPPAYVFFIALVPVLLASALTGLQLVRPGTKTESIATMYACTVAVIVPFALMMRHPLVRLVRMVLPRARLVRRRR